MKVPVAMTGNHKVMMADGTWKEVQAIQKGDVVQGLLGNCVYTCSGDSGGAREKRLFVHSNGTVIRVIGRRISECAG